MNRDDDRLNGAERDNATEATKPQDVAAAAPQTEAGNTAMSRNLTPQAERALAEAEERRRQQAQNGTEQPREVGGRDGPDPARYGDWEKGGIASDF